MPLPIPVAPVALKNENPGTNGVVFGASFGVAGVFFFPAAAFGVCGPPTGLFGFFMAVPSFGLGAPGFDGPAFPESAIND